MRSTATGAPTFAGIAGFANNKYTWDQTHLSNAVSLKSDTKGVFDFDLSASSYNYLQDIQLNPFTVTPSGVGYSLNGKITRNDGTNWQNADAKGIWRPFGLDGPHEVSFGIHGDRYRLENPVYASSVWYATPSTGNWPTLFDGIGETRTGALWVQDAWKIVPNLKLTLGGRLETWRALDGFNLNTTTKRSRRHHFDGCRSISPDSIRRISRQRPRCRSIRTRNGTSPPISARPIVIRPSPSSIRT